LNLIQKICILPPFKFLFEYKMSLKNFENKKKKNKKNLNFYLKKNKMSDDEDIESGSEIDEDEDEEMSGEDSMEEGGSKKPKCRSAKELLEKPLNQINKIMEMCNLSGVVARQLLKTNKWYIYNFFENIYKYMPLFILIQQIFSFPKQQKIKKGF
jgi:hypothetical protein